MAGEGVAAIGPLEEQLFQAVLEENSSRIIQLRKSGAKCNFLYEIDEDGNRTTPLIQAILRKAEEVVFNLVTGTTQPSDYAKASNADFFEEYMSSIRVKRMEVTRAEEGAPSQKRVPLDSDLRIEDCDINMRDSDGKTPLMRAIEGREYFRIAKILIKAGCDVNPAPRRFEEAPIAMALAHGQEDIAELLIDAGAKFDPNKLLLDAASWGRAKICRILLSNFGADANYFHAGLGFLPSTPLSMAVRHEDTYNEEVIRLLLDFGADPCLVEPGAGETGTCALYWAMYKPKLSALRIMLASGSGELPQMLLHHAAATCRDDESYSAVLNRSAHTNINFLEPVRGNTALHVAFGRWNTPVVKILLERGAKGATKLLNASGYTPLGLLIDGYSNFFMWNIIYEERRLKRSECCPIYGRLVDLFLDAGGDIDAGSVSPLRLAILEERSPMLALWLVYRGASVRTLLPSPDKSDAERAAQVYAIRARLATFKRRSSDGRLLVRMLRESGLHILWNEPPTLQSLARAAIRERCGSRVRHLSVPRPFLPPRMRDYVGFKEFLPWEQ